MVEVYYMYLLKYDFDKKKKIKNVSIEEKRKW